MENMYTGKSSRNPNKPLIWGTIIGLGIIAFGIILYYDLAAWENTNEEKQLHSYIWALYDMGGKLAVATVFSVIGLGVIGVGYKKTIDLKEIKNKAKNN